jgi:predicted RNA-binding protein Jag
MNKHTPGPWIKRAVPNAGLKGHIGYAIDFNEDQGRVVDFVYEEADANLIAAAPDLLEAMELLLNSQFEPADSAGSWGSITLTSEDWRSAKKAIAKAKGQSK